MVIKMALQHLRKQSSEKILMQQAIASLSDDEQVDFEERAAIMEYDGGLSRAEAEKRALERAFKQG